MKLQILDSKSEGNATCYLCKVDLPEYIKSIPENYMEFDVQRGIVNNRYLDHLADTVAYKKHIPPIVLVANVITDALDESGEPSGEIEVLDFRILDGLQRTHRLKVISQTIQFLLQHRDDDDVATNSAKFCRAHSKEIKSLGSSTGLVRSLVSHGCISLNSSYDFFDGNILWLEVWKNLSEEEQIKKMLLLNAGHKSVNIKHQLELLFLGTLFKLENLSPAGVTFVREKEQSAILYSKSRRLGEFHFAHVVSALIALSAGAIVNTNSDFVSDIQTDSIKDIDLIDGFDIELLKEFVHFIVSLDSALNKIYGEQGVKWLGREVVLIGFFGAIGAYANASSIDMHLALRKLTLRTEEIAQQLNLDGFEAQRNSIELNKVNIGNINKKAVFKATYDAICGNSMRGWPEYFGVQ